MIKHRNSRSSGSRKRVRGLQLGTVVVWGFVLAVALISSASAQSPVTSVFADFDGDGDADLVELADNMVPTVYTNTRGVLQATPASGLTSLQGFQGLAYAVDVDGDGDFDLVTAGGQILANRGTALAWSMRCANELGNNRISMSSAGGNCAPLSAPALSLLQTASVTNAVQAGGANASFRGEGRGFTPNGVVDVMATLPSGESYPLESFDSWIRSSSTGSFSWAWNFGSAPETGVHTIAFHDRATREVDVVRLTSTYLENRDVICDGRVATIVGTSGNDTLFGTEGPDVIAALQGDDTIWGADGDDVICGGKGNDVIYGGAGFDILFGAQGNDQIYAVHSASNRADRRGARMFGGVGDDTIYGSDRWDRMQGGPGNDQLYGYEGRDWMRGGPSNDRLDGGLGVDDMNGANGSDHLFLTKGDVAIGGAGRDRCDHFRNQPSTVRSCGDGRYEGSPALVCSNRVLRAVWNARYGGSFPLDLGPYAVSNAVCADGVARAFVSQEFDDNGNPDFGSAVFVSDGNSWRAVTRLRTPSPATDTERLVNAGLTQAQAARWFSLDESASTDGETATAILDVPRAVLATYNRLLALTERRDIDGLAQLAESYPGFQANCCEDNYGSVKETWVVLAGSEGAFLDAMRSGLIATPRPSGSGWYWQNNRAWPNTAFVAIDASGEWTAGALLGA